MTCLVLHGLCKCSFVFSIVYLERKNPDKLEKVFNARNKDYFLVFILSNEIFDPGNNTKEIGQFEYEQCFLGLSHSPYALYVDINCKCEGLQMHISTLFVINNTETKYFDCSPVMF